MALELASVSHVVWLNPYYEERLNKSPERDLAESGAGDRRFLIALCALTTHLVASNRNASSVLATRSPKTKVSAEPNYL